MQKRRRQNRRALKNVLLATDKLNGAHTTTTTTTTKTFTKSLKPVPVQIYPKIYHSGCLATHPTPLLPSSSSEQQQSSTRLAPGPSASSVVVRYTLTGLVGATNTAGTRFEFEFRIAILLGNTSRALHTLPSSGFMLNFHIITGIKRLNTGPEACF